MEHRLNEMRTEALWNKARAAGMSRRKFLALLASSGAAAVLVACAPQAAPSPSPTATPSPTTKSTPTPAPAQKIELVAQASWGSTSRSIFAFFDPLLNMIEKNSGGRITFKRFYNAELVSTNDQLEACGKGTIDFMSCPGTYFESIVPEGDYDLCFYNFPSYASAALFYDLPEVNAIYQQAYAKTNTFHIGHYSNTGAGVFFTNFPVTKISDVKGKKFRTGGGIVNQCTQALGISPVFIAATEQYPALQRGTVDGIVNAEYYIWFVKYYEVIKYICSTPCYATNGQAAWMNMDKWNKLGPELQKIVLDAYDRIKFWHVIQQIQEADQIPELAKSKGVIYTELPPEELAKAKALVEPVKAAWAKRSPGCTQLYELIKAWEKKPPDKWTLK